MIAGAFRCFTFSAPPPGAPLFHETFVATHYHQKWSVLDESGYREIEHERLTPSGHFAPALIDGRPALIGSEEIVFFDDFRHIAARWRIEGGFGRFSPDGIDEPARAMQIARVGRSDRPGRLPCLLTLCAAPQDMRFFSVLEYDLDAGAARWLHADSLRAQAAWPTALSAPDPASFTSDRVPLSLRNFDPDLDDVVWSEDGFIIKTFGGRQYYHLRPRHVFGRLDPETRRLAASNPETTEGDHVAFCDHRLGLITPTKLLLGRRATNNQRLLDIATGASAPLKIAAEFRNWIVFHIGETRCWLGREVDGDMTLRNEDPGVIEGLGRFRAAMG